jgi:hypothetical protein
VRLAICCESYEAGLRFYEAGRLRFVVLRIQNQPIEEVKHPVKNTFHSNMDARCYQLADPDSACTHEISGSESVRYQCYFVGPSL